MTWRGRFFDGRSAARRDAEIAIVPAALHIRPEGGGTLVWPFDRLRWVEPPPAAGPARLALDGDPARLDIEDAGFAPALRAVWPDIDGAAAKRERRGRTAIIVVAAVAGMTALIWVAAAMLPVLVTPLVPDSFRRAVGDAMVGQIVGVFGQCEAPAGRTALDRLITRIGPDRDYTVTVADSGIVNALAAPGGRIVVFRGLIEFAGAPEELAGVLAHETGHAVHAHPTQAVIREIGLSATLDLLTGSAGGHGLAGQAASVLARTAYSQDAEREADDTAVDLLGRAGIDAAGMAALFERLSVREGEMPEAVQLFSTHPRSADRAARIRAGAAGSGETGPAMSAADWQAIRAMCGKG